MSQVRHEIFCLKGKDDWALVETLEDRDAAVEKARLLLDEHQASAVRVVRQTFQPEHGNYAAATIFEDGHSETKKSKKAEEPEIPPLCSKPDDFYTYDARITIARILGEWLGKQKLTVTELLHSAAALEKFEGSGNTYQHAIQKIAVAHAQGSESSVTQIVKDFDELCSAAIQRVVKDDRRGAFPVLQPGQFGALAEGLASQPSGAYVLSGAIAKYLNTAKGWDAKLQRLLLLMNGLPQEGPGRALLLKTIDSVVAEMLHGAAALADLLGHNPDLGHAVLNLADLFLGKAVTVEGTGGRSINDLARSFAKDELPESRTAIAGRILSELKGLKRLCPNSLEEEFKVQRQLGNLLMKSLGKYFSHEDLVAAFTDRSKRLVTPEPLEQYMESAKTSDEKIERLLVVEENIVGAENKRKLSAFIVPVITANNFGDHLAPGVPPPQRLRRVAELQERVLRSGFQDVQKNQIAVALDAVAQRIEERTKFFASLEARLTNPSERAQTLLKLCAAGVFTQGDLVMKAKRMLIASLSKPGFLAAYMAHLEQERRGNVGKEQVVAELSRQLEGIGIAPEDALRTLAA